MNLNVTKIFAVSRGRFTFIVKKTKIGLLARVVLISKTKIYTKMKSFLFLILFCLFFSGSNAQEKFPIYISSWVAVPSRGNFVKPLLYVDFWATWCGPCIQSMPHTKKLAKEFEKNVFVLYISDEPSKKVRSFMTKRKKDFYSGIDNSGNNISNYSVSALPHSILLDPSGNVIWEGSPTDMNSDLMRKFVDLYKGEKGDENRIKKIKPERASEKISWNTYTHKSVKIRYFTPKNAADEFSVNNKNEYYLSGNLKYFVSVLKEVPGSQVTCKPEKDTKYVFSCKADNADKFRDALKGFLKKKCKLNISHKNKKQKIFILEDTDNQTFFNKRVYNFEKGDNTYLADDMTISLDNSTVSEMTAVFVSIFGTQLFVQR